MQGKTANDIGASRVRSLTDPIRLGIVDVLGEGAKSVSEIAEQMSVPPDRLYYHLDRLEQGGLVALKAIRPKRIYELASPLDDSAAPLTHAEKGEFVVAVFDLARIEAEAAYRRGPENGQLFMKFGALRLPRKELAKLLDAVEELVEAAAERESPRARSTRFIFGAYALKR